MIIHEKEKCMMPTRFLDARRMWIRSTSAHAHLFRFRFLEYDFCF